MNSACSSCRIRPVSARKCCARSRAGRRETIRFGEPKRLIAAVGARIAVAEADGTARELRRGLLRGRLCPAHLCRKANAVSAQPDNQGTLCPKGAATLDLFNSPLRLRSVLYRAAYSDHCKQKQLGWAMEQIA